MVVRAGPVLDELLAEHGGTMDDLVKGDEKDAGGTEDDVEVIEETPAPAKKATTRKKAPAKKATAKKKAAKKKAAKKKAAKKS